MTDETTPRRPRLSANGRREVIADAIFDLQAIASALQAERHQVICIADDEDGDAMSDRRRARFIAMELNFQRDKLVAWIGELGALVEEMEADDPDHPLHIPDDAGA